jgi:uroporphyrinogen decarboxylase
MKPVERILNALNLNPTDTVPVLPLVGVHAAEVRGTKVTDALRNGREMARAVLYCLRKYGYDGVFPFMDLSVEAEALGCETLHREGEIPTVVRPALNHPSDIRELSIPEPSKDGRLPRFIEAVEFMSSEVGTEAAVCAYITGPFTLASHLLGMTNLFISCRQNPGTLKELLNFTTQVGVVYGKSLACAGAKVIMILEPVAALISPAHFREFVSPYISTMVKEIRTPLILHVCGNASPLVEEMAGLGINGISIDAPVDIGFAKEKTSGKLCIVGNVSPVHIMLHGSPDDVRKICESCIQKGGKRGFILSSGCEVPKKTPPENIETMVRIARTYDWRD